MRVQQLEGARRPALYMKQAMGEVIEKRDLQQLVRSRAALPFGMTFFLPPRYTCAAHSSSSSQAIWWGLSKRPNFWAKTPTEAALAHALHRHAQRLLAAEVPPGGEDAAFLHVHRPAPP